jgi:hypothetical protein
MSFLSEELITTLNHRQVQHLPKLRLRVTLIPLQRFGGQATSWSCRGIKLQNGQNLHKELCGAGITLIDNTKDELRWTGGDLSGELTVKNCYNAILSTQNLPIWSGWKLKCWKWSVQLKILLFFWLATDNRILTWDILLKKGWVGPGMCYLCRASSEDNPHLLIHCAFTKRVWAILAQILNSKFSWNGQTIDDCMDVWLLNKTMSKILPLLTSWYIWKERNMALFEGKTPSTMTVAFKTIGALNKKQIDIKPQVLRKKPFIRLHGYTVAFFDGAAVAGGSIWGRGFSEVYRCNGLQMVHQLWSRVQY